MSWIWAKSDSLKLNSFAALHYTQFSNCLGFVEVWTMRHQGFLEPLLNSAQRLTFKFDYAQVIFIPKYHDSIFTSRPGWHLRHGVFVGPDNMLFSLERLLFFLLTGSPVYRMYSREHAKWGFFFYLNGPKIFFFFYNDDLKANFFCPLAVQTKERTK
jgi:hypothetical protein